MQKDNVIYGIHAVEAALEKDHVDVLFMIQDKRHEKLKKLVGKAKQKNCEVQFFKKDKFEKQFQAFNHQGVAATLKQIKQYSESDIKQLIDAPTGPLLILILDGITDPHNLGACLRSGDASGVDMVIVPKDKSAPLTPVVRKVASGAAETVAFIPVTNLARTIDMLKDKGVWIYGAAGEEAKPLYDIDFKGHSAIVMGAEGIGLRRLTREKCDELFSIPMKGTVESLNVSVATGICLFEVLRQRLS